MKAILVSVDFTDILSITLPYNRHHFDEVWIVTTQDEVGSPKMMQMAADNRATLFGTDAFYEDGAIFNKWKALEQGLEAMGRGGWICIMDADVLWPKEVELCGCPCHSGIGGMMHFTACCKPDCGLIQGRLYTPKRRMFTDLTKPIPPESEWGNCPYHHYLAEWSGYTQIFHGSDPALPKPPWHDTSWSHAGGGDSFFSFMWTADKRVRPPFEILHLGDSLNWCGRTINYVDGTKPAEANQRREQLTKLLHERSLKGSREDRYDHEKIKNAPPIS